MKKLDDHLTIDNVVENETPSLDLAIGSTHISRPKETHLVSRIVSINKQGYPIIEYGGQQLVADMTVNVAISDIGEKCLLVFPDNQDSPIIVGMLKKPNNVVESQDKLIEANESITLNCGKSSLILEANGTVKLKGVTVTTQAYGSNRVKGAAVKIN